jgi:hypothetical protein
MTLNVFLDANVLVPVAMTDMLLSLGEGGIIDPHWSAAVLGEARRALGRLHPDVPADAWARRFGAMGRAFPEADTHQAGDAGTSNASRSNRAFCSLPDAGPPASSRRRGTPWCRAPMSVRRRHLTTPAKAHHCSHKAATGSPNSFLPNR